MPGPLRTASLGSVRWGVAERPRACALPTATIVVARDAAHGVWGNLHLEKGRQRSADVRPVGARGWPRAWIKSHAHWPFEFYVPTIFTVHTLQQRTPTQHRSTCEVSLPLFEGPTGAMSLGRLRDGVDAGRPVLLRRVSASESVGFALTVRSTSRLTHPAVLKTIAVTTARDAMFVACECVDGITVFELLQVLERANAGLDAAVAVRVVADALRAAEMTSRLLERRETPRCLFIDTIWIAAYGSTLISEPLVAAFAQRGAAAADQKRELRRNQSAAADDVALALELLIRLVLGRARGSLLPVSDPRIPQELLRLRENSERWTSRGDLERALRDLPSRLVASEQAVADSLARWVGPLLKSRREVANPGRGVTAVDSSDETQSYAGLCGSAGASGPESSERIVRPTATEASGDALEETRNWRRNKRPEGATSEISTERVVLDVPFDGTESDDEQEVTRAFRPSRFLGPSVGRGAPLPSFETRSAANELLSSSGVQPHMGHVQRSERRSRRVLARAVLVMVVVAVLVWGLSHLLVRM